MTTYTLLRAKNRGHQDSTGRNDEKMFQHLDYQLFDTGYELELPDIEWTKSWKTEVACHNGRTMGNTAVDAPETIELVCYSMADGEDSWFTRSDELLEKLMNL